MPALLGGPMRCFFNKLCCFPPFAQSTAKGAVKGAMRLQVDQMARTHTGRKNIAGQSIQANAPAATTATCPPVRFSASLQAVAERPCATLIIAYRRRGNTPPTAMHTEYPARLIRQQRSISLWGKIVAVETAEKRGRAAG